MHSPTALTCLSWPLVTSEQWGACRTYFALQPGCRQTQMSSGHMGGTQTRPKPTDNQQECRES